jgi:hypothetical protein
MELIQDYDSRRFAVLVQHRSRWIVRGLGISQVIQLIVDDSIIYDKILIL